MEGMHRSGESAPGYNQMNPSLLLHLGAQSTDIRGFELFIFFQYNLSTKQTSVLCVNSYQRSLQPISEPQQRLQHALNHAHKTGDRSLMKDPFWVHLIYLGVVLNWWKATLSYFEDELIRHEKIIERRMRLQEGNRPDTLGSVPTNRALHAMTAHCMRYGTEILTIIAVIEELTTQHSDIGRRAGLSEDDMQRVRRGFRQQLAEANAILRTQAELAKKTKNTLALVNPPPPGPPPQLALTRTTRSSSTPSKPRTTAARSKSLKSTRMTSRPRCSSPIKPRMIVLR